MIQKSKKVYKQIFLDLDDTLLDTTQAAYEFHGFQNIYKTHPGSRGKRNVHKHVNMDFKDFWHTLPTEFWANIPKYLWADDIVREARCKYGVPNVFILTSQVPNAACTSGKQLWVNKNWPELTQNLIMSRNKHDLVGPNSILVDDSYNHHLEFKNKGQEENFCLFPSYQNELHDMAQMFQAKPHLPIKYLRMLGVL